VAIGECGLDWLREDYDGQLELFHAQVELASRYEYPLLIHSVRTHDEVAALLKREQSGCRGWCTASAAPGSRPHGFWIRGSISVWGCNYP